MKIGCSVLPYPNPPAQTLLSPFQRRVSVTSLYSSVLPWGSSVLSAASSPPSTAQTHPHPLLPVQGAAPPHCPLGPHHTPIHTPLTWLCSSPGMNHWPLAKLPLPSSLSHWKPFFAHPKPYTIPTPAIFSFFLMPSLLLALPILPLSLHSLPWAMEESTGPGFPQSL